VPQPDAFPQKLDFALMAGVEIRFCIFLCEIWIRRIVVEGVNRQYYVCFERVA